jgi:hypothetical protein
MFLHLQHTQHLNHCNLYQIHVAIELFIQGGKKKIFFHNLEIRFKLKCLAIILFALCDITSLNNENYISNNQEWGTIIPFVILGANPIC